MIGAKELERYCEESGAIAGGDWESQLATWGVDAEEFMAFAQGYGLRMQQLALEGLPLAYAFTIDLCAGFELGYRACLDAAPQGLGELDASRILTCSDCGRASDDLLHVPHDTGDAYYCPDCRGED